MTHSEQLNELGKALAEAQLELKPAEMTGENPGFKRDGKATQYATLADCWKAWQAVGPKHGLSLAQGFTPGENCFYVHTRLLHVSGQWLESILPMPFGSSPQQTGSAISYGKRYGLCAMVGLVGEIDDDGHSASQAAHTQNRPHGQKSTPVPPKSQGTAEKSVETAYGVGLDRAVQEANAASIPAESSKWTPEQAAIIHAISAFRKTIKAKGYADMSPKEVLEFARDWPDVAKVSVDLVTPADIKLAGDKLPDKTAHGAVISDPN